jgi:hypothetical protein
MGLLNGLSGLGAGIAQFAGAAGLEAQKASLAQDNLKLADQLTGARESAGRQEAGQIAATAQATQNTFLAGQGDLTRANQLAVAQTSASATLGAAGISAAASNYATNARKDEVYQTLAQSAPEAQAKTLMVQQQTALEKVQAESAQAMQGAQKALADEQAKPAPDPDKLASLKSNVLALGYSATNDMEVKKAAAATYTVDAQAVERFQQEVINANAEYNKMGMTDTDRVQAKAALDAANQRLAGAYAALKFSRRQAHPGMDEAPPANAAPLTNFDQGGGKRPNAPAAPTAKPAAVRPNSVYPGSE